MSFDQMDSQFGTLGFDGGHCKIHTWEDKLEPYWSQLENFGVGSLEVA